jgi:hypothetical protein
VSTSIEDVLGFVVLAIFGFYHLLVDFFNKGSYTPTFASGGSIIELIMDINSSKVY